MIVAYVNALPSASKLKTILENRQTKVHSRLSATPFVNNVRLSIPFKGLARCSLKELSEPEYQKLIYLKNARTFSIPIADFNFQLKKFETKSGKVIETRPFDEDEESGPFGLFCDGKLIQDHLVKPSVLVGHRLLVQTSNEGSFYIRTDMVDKWETSRHCDVVENIEENDLTLFKIEVASKKIWHWKDSRLMCDEEAVGPCGHIDDKLEDLLVTRSFVIGVSSKPQNSGSANKRFSVIDLISRESRRVLASHNFLEEYMKIGHVCKIPRLGHLLVCFGYQPERSKLRSIMHSPLHFWLVKGTAIFMAQWAGFCDVDYAAPLLLSKSFGQVDVCFRRQEKNSKHAMGQSRFKPL